MESVKKPKQVSAKVLLTLLSTVSATVLWGIILQYIPEYIPEYKNISFPITRRQRCRIARRRNGPRTSRTKWIYDDSKVQREKESIEYFSGGHIVLPDTKVSKVVFTLLLKVTQVIVPDKTHYPYIVNRWTTSATECIRCEVQFFGPIAEIHGYIKKNVWSMVVSGSRVQLILLNGDEAFDISVSAGFIGQFHKKVIKHVPRKILVII